MHRLLDASAAEKHLGACDPVMARIVAAIGPIELREDSANPFRSLARSIVFQQLSGKAAGTIFSRFVALFEDSATGAPMLARSDPEWTPVEGAFPLPEAVLARSDEELRGVGLSRQKVASLRSLSEHFASGELGSEQFEHWDDEEIIAHLCRVRGIGRWTAEMFLIFHLRRPDVLPVNDVGVNRAIKTQYGLAEVPVADEIRRIGEPWRPFASAACWYLWRTEDLRLPVDVSE